MTLQRVNKNKGLTGSKLSYVTITSHVMSVGHNMTSLESNRSPATAEMIRITRDRSNHTRATIKNTLQLGGRG